ncbi:class I fructose-bisphosphate aldolase [Calidithermus chliarophilus]|uniref:class I fructose-bisphosphate aldolase n=1 Tax=Calidithermus chliarophilus TaxID=52023 RepID=UPI0003FE2BF9|nr:fructose-bisphosphate aldolase [Calidithermus chliarophilus]
MNTFNRNLDHLPLGVRSRLETLLSRTGGRLAVLPIDQGLEHGPIDFLDSPEAADPEHQFRLAAEAGFSGIAAHLGLAEKYLPDHAGQVPLILKLNGKTGIPPDEEAFSPLTAGVEDALRLNAQAVGYTLYVGSPAQDRDIAQFQRVRAEAGRYGLPVIVWAYPRGRWVDQKGGKDSPYAVEYAVRVALELGADVVKVNIPRYDPARKEQYPGEYKNLELSPHQALRRVVDLAGRALVIVSGGARLSEDAAVAQARLALEAGAAGLIFGRNVWQRPFPRALELSRRLLDLVRGRN